MRLSGEFRPFFDFSNAFNPNPVIAIYDARGYDTLDVSGYTQDQVDAVKRCVCCFPSLQPVFIT